MTTSEQEGIHELIRSTPPAPGAELRGWVVLADWRLPDGEEALTLIGSPDAHVVQVKGYLHEGLYDIARGAYRVAAGRMDDVRHGAVIGG